MRVANIRALNVAETCSQSGSIKIASIAFRFIVGSNTLYRLRNIYIYIVCNYSQPVAAAVATDIYIYTRIHIYIYTLSISLSVAIFAQAILASSLSCYGVH